MSDICPHCNERYEWHNFDHLADVCYPKQADRIRAALGNGSDEEAWRPGHSWQDEVVRRLEDYTRLREALERLVRHDSAADARAGRLPDEGCVELQDARDALEDTK